MESIQTLYTIISYRCMNNQFITPPYQTCPTHDIAYIAIPLGGCIVGNEMLHIDIDIGCGKWITPSSSACLLGVLKVCTPILKLKKLMCMMHSPMLLCVVEMVEWTCNILL